MVENIPAGWPLLAVHDETRQECPSYIQAKQTLRRTTVERDSQRPEKRMKYRVQWSRAAEADLANVRTNASNRSLISEAAHRLDLALADNPHLLGESRSGDNRIAFSSPLGVEYKISDEDRTVLVFAVWVFHPR